MIAHHHRLNLTMHFLCHFFMTYTVMVTGIVFLIALQVTLYLSTGTFCVFKIEAEFLDVIGTQVLRVNCSCSR